jgi:hypothetical protein
MLFLYFLTILILALALLFLFLLMFSCSPCCFSPPFSYPFFIFLSPPLSLSINFVQIFSTPRLISISFHFSHCPYSLLEVIQELSSLLLALHDGINLPALPSDLDHSFRIARFLVWSATLANLTSATSMHLCCFVQQFRILICRTVWVPSSHFPFSTCLSSLSTAPYLHWWLADLLSRSLKLIDTLYH